MMLSGFMLLLFFTSVAAEQKTIRVYDKNRDMDIGEGHEWCRLPCSVQSTNGKNLINPPYVTWERTPDPKYSDLYIPITNGSFWKELDLFFINIPHYCKIREGTSSGIYDCDLYIRPCGERYTGNYRCVVYDFDGGSNVTHHFLYSSSSSSDFARCVLPVVALNTLQLISSNESLSVNFSWTPLESENVTICFHEFSVRQHRASVPYEFEDRMDPLQDSEKYTQVNQQTHHVFNNINRHTYYLFELRVEASSLSKRYHSYVYYFGDQVPARVTDPPSDHSVIRAREGDSVTVPCEGTGIPTPSVQLLREVTSTPQACSGCPPVGKSNVFPSVRQRDAGEYFCVAANILVNPPLGKRTPRDWKTIVLIVEPVAADLPTNVSRCLPYTHSTCGPFLVDNDDIFIDASVNNDVEMLQLQENVTSLFRKIERRANRSEVIALDSVLKTRCHRLAQSIACHSVYPYCDPDHNVPTPRLICKTTCDTFSAGGICERFISEAETSKLYSQLTANCDTREHPAGSSPECIPLDFDTAQIGHYEPEEPSWCALGNGRSYVGSERRTRSGLDCQSWESQLPHKHPFLPSTYSPELINRFACRNPGGVGAGPWCYTSNPNVRWEYCDVPQCEICEQYNNYGFCHSIGGYNGNSTVYVDRSPSKWGQLGLSSVEPFLENLLRQLTDVGNSTWTPGCEHTVRQLLCQATLPLCKNKEAAAPLIVCSGCQLLDTIQFCSTDVYSRLVTEMRRQSSKFYFHPNDCMATAVDLDISSIGPDCMPPPQGLASETDDCYSSSDRGQSYTGHLATTQRGEHCQSWSEPHLLFHPGLYPELEGAANLCRNPGQLKDRIWCFTSESAWDYCPVPTNCSITEASAQSKDLMIGLTAFAVVLTIFLSVLLCAGISCCYMCRKHKLQRSHSPPLTLHSDSKGCRTEKMIDNGSYVPLSIAKMNDTLRKFRQVDSQIPKSNVHYIRQIGQGNFGVVFMGRMYSSTSSDSDEETVVAVKTLKDECQEALDDFAREARIMMQLDHPNIIRMYGVSTDSSPYYLIFEYMDLGDLSKYLREHASSQQRRLMDPSGYRHSRTESTLSDDPPSLSHHQLADMCKQIAAGMEYLAANNHIHRDLACRNCLVKSCAKADETCSGVIVKIGDFGMSHGLYQKNYYRVEGQAVLPIRWMSPEAVIFGKFTTAGDVWSFGVTMWEIFSFAMQPYFGLSNEEVTKHIRRGQCLEKPMDCPDKIYSIMKMCWTLEPDSRPSFLELQGHINEVRISLSSESSTCSNEGHSINDCMYLSPPCAIQEEEEEREEEEEEEEGEDNVFEDSPPEDVSHMMEMGLATHPHPTSVCSGGGVAGGSVVGGVHRLNDGQFEYNPRQQQQEHLFPRLHLVGDEDNDTTTNTTSSGSDNSATESYA